jgi:hypothetical protein
MHSRTPRLRFEGLGTTLSPCAEWLARECNTGRRRTHPCTRIDSRIHPRLPRKRGAAQDSVGHRFDPTRVRPPPLRAVERPSLARSPRGNPKSTPADCRGRGIVGHVGSVDDYAVHQHRNRDDTEHDHLPKFPIFLRHPLGRKRHPTVLLELVALCLRGARCRPLGRGVGHDPAHTQVRRRDLIDVEHWQPWPPTPHG